MPKCEECGSEHGTEFGVKMHRSHTHLETIEDYFWDKVNKGEPDECWEWVGCINSYGYGSLKVDGSHMMAGRVYITEIKEVELSSNVCVCHKCDNRKCVNPNHLYVGTVQDNVDDRVERKYESISGESLPQTKLNEDQVKEIYRLTQNSDVSHESIAEGFPVSSSAVSSIANGENWSKITEELDNNQN